MGHIVKEAFKVSFEDIRRVEAARNLASGGNYSSSRKIAMLLISFRAETPLDNAVIIHVEIDTSAHRGDTQRTELSSLLKIYSCIFKTSFLVLNQFSDVTHHMNNLVYGKFPVPVL
jgi:hypothetical protein